MFWTISPEVKALIAIIQDASIPWSRSKYRFAQSGPYSSQLDDYRPGVPEFSLTSGLLFTSVKLYDAINFTWAENRALLKAMRQATLDQVIREATEAKLDRC